jgi:hypothetical protein
LSEVLIGRVAGPTIGRQAFRSGAFNSGFGYAVYFSNNRIVSLSYTKLLSRGLLKGRLKKKFLARGLAR